MESIVVAGKLNTRHFQRAKKCAEFLRASRLATATVLALVPTDYETLVERLRKEMPNKKALQHSGNTFCYLNAPVPRYVGNCRDLLDWAGAKFGYSDSSNDMIYRGLAKLHMRSYMDKSRSSFVYIDLSVDGEAEESLTIELFQSEAPNTCDNFRKLCEGVKDAATGEEWGYEGSEFHRIKKGGWVQGGDVVDGSGKNGKSASLPDGAPIADETYGLCFDKPGMLGMANTGPHTGQSQFFFTTRPLPWLDTTKVAFGRVIEGLRTLRVIERLPTENERPLKKVTIDRCGPYEL